MTNWTDSCIAVRCSGCAHGPHAPGRICATTGRRIASLGAPRRCEAFEPGVPAPAPPKPPPKPKLKWSAPKKKVKKKRKQKQAKRVQPKHRQAVRYVAMEYLPPPSRPPTPPAPPPTIIETRPSARVISLAEFRQRHQANIGPLDPPPSTPPRGT
jgi:hypothetical protein